MNMRHKTTFATLIILLSLNGLAAPNPPNPDDIARPGQDNVEPPFITYRVNPIYPDRALITKISGYVILEAIFRKDGKISGIKVLRGLGKGFFGFEDEAIDALKQMSFTPGTVNGEASDVTLTLKVDFAYPPLEERVHVLKWDVEMKTCEMDKPKVSLKRKGMKDRSSTTALDVPVDLLVDEFGHIIEYQMVDQGLDKLLDPCSWQAQLEDCIARLRVTPAQDDCIAHPTTLRIKLKLYLDEME